MINGVLRTKSNIGKGVLALSLIAYAYGSLNKLDTFTTDSAAQKRDQIEATQEEHKIEIAKIIPKLEHHLAQLERNGEIKQKNGTITREVTIGGAKIDLTVPTAQYKSDAIASVIPHNSHQQAQGLQHFAKHNQGLHNIANKLREIIDSRTTHAYPRDPIESTLMSTTHIFQEINRNVTYQKDNKFRPVGNEPCTPYATELSRGTDLRKSPSQFIIDGGGDCDDYALAAAHLLDKFDIQTHLATIWYTEKTESNHMVVAVEIPSKTPNEFRAYMRNLDWSISPNEQGHLMANYSPKNEFKRFNSDKSRRKKRISFELNGKVYVAMEPQSNKKGFNAAYNPASQDFHITLRDNQTGEIYHPKTICWEETRKSDLIRPQVPSQYQFLKTK